VVGIKTATDLWARAGLLNAGIVPDRTPRSFPWPSPDGDAVRTGKISAGPSSRSIRRRSPAAAEAVTAVEAVATTTSCSISGSRQVPQGEPGRGRLSSRLRRCHEVLPPNTAQPSATCTRADSCARRWRSTSERRLEARSRCARGRPSLEKLSSSCSKTAVAREGVNVPEMVIRASCRVDLGVADLDRVDQTS